MIGTFLMVYSAVFICGLVGIAIGADISSSGNKKSGSWTTWFCKYMTLNAEDFDYIGKYL